MGRAPRQLGAGGRGTSSCNGWAAPPAIWFPAACPSVSH